MNPYLNPIFSLKILKKYLFDINRTWNFSSEKLKKYQDKAFKKTIKYAYKTPLYHEKYKKAGVHPNDISGIKDIKKLPLITKNDIIEGCPDEIVPNGYKKDKAYLVGTSGSSGRPMSMYKDIEYITVEGLAGGVRVLRAYNMSWRKTRITNIGDFSLPNTTDEECLRKGLLGNLSSFFSLNNYQNIYTGEEINKIMKKINNFHPELLIGYTSTLMGLASLKRKGQGKKVNPEYIISSGEVLDSYTRKYIEEAFEAPVFNLYAATEGGVIAFECLQKNLHLNSDFIYTEILDKNGEPVDKGDFGSMVITRLYPGGTPIIRYTGLNDIASVSEDYCSCGLNTPLLKSLEGRKKDAIVLPDGRVFPPATISMPLSKVLEKFNTYQIKRFQFIQKNIDDIELRVKIEEEQRGKPISANDLIGGLKKRYQDFVGENIDLKVKEVEKLEIPKDSIFPPLIISKIDSKKIDSFIL